MQAIHIEWNLALRPALRPYEQHAVQLGEVGKLLDAGVPMMSSAAMMETRVTLDLQRVQQTLQAHQPINIDGKVSDFRSGFGEEAEVCGAAHGTCGHHMARLAACAHRADERQVVGLGAAGVR